MIIKITSVLKKPRKEMGSWSKWSFSAFIKIFVSWYETVLSTYARSKSSNLRFLLYFFDFGYFLLICLVQFETTLTPYGWKFSFLISYSVLRIWSPTHCLGATLNLTCHWYQPAPAKENDNNYGIIINNNVFSNVTIPCHTLEYRKLQIYRVPDECYKVDKRKAI